MSEIYFSANVRACEAATCEHGGIAKKTNEPTLELAVSAKIPY